MAERHILHIIPVDAPNERVDTVRRFLGGLAHEGTRVEVMTLPGGPTDLEYHVDDHKAITMMLEWAANRDRVYDGILVACFYDPGVRELREALDVPVVGIGEASMLVASCLGHSLSVLVASRKCVPKMSDNALRYGFNGRIASWRPIGMSVELLRQDPKAAYDALLKAGKAAVLEDGAEVVVLGCAAMEDAAAKLQEDLACPVVDPVAAGFKLIETLADLRVRLGLSVSKVCDYRPRGRA